MILSAILAACNVYVGLKLGSALGMSLIAVLLGYGFWNGVQAFSALGHPFSLFENNISQTAASSGATVASAGLVAAIPALTMLTGQALPWHWLTVWMLSVMLVGILIAVPLRRQMIVNEKLPFVGGIACAELLRELHAAGSGAVQRIALFFGTLIGSGAVKIFCDLRRIKEWELPFSIRGLTARSLTFSLSPSLMLFGVGGLIGIRIATSLLVGAFVSYTVVVPRLVESGVIPLTTTVPSAEMPSAAIEIINNEQAATYDPERRVIVWTGRMSAGTYDLLRYCSSDPAYTEQIEKLYLQTQTAQPSFQAMNAWLLWPGTTLMVVGSLTALILAWPSMLATFRFSKPRDANVGTQHRESVSISLLIIGALAVLALAIGLQIALFEIVWWAAVVAVLLSAFLATVAARVSGETGINPIGAMGKVTQLVFGALIPQNPAPNLMAANVTGGAASQCADLMHDLKCGHLIGASPRKQVWAQLCGACIGALVGSAAYLVLIPEPAALPTENWPVPAARIWMAVAKLFAGGFEQLPAGAAAAMLVAGAVAIALAVLERHAPKAWRSYMLSPISLGFAFILPAQLSISMFLGGLIAWLLGRWIKGWTARFLVAGCAGLMVGESLTDIGQAVFTSFF